MTIIFNKLQKIIEDPTTGEWKTVTFYRTTYSERPSSKPGIKEWCYKKYGSPKQLGPYWIVYGFIILSEEAYMLWELCS